MLNIFPLLNVDKEGHLAPREKIRGKRNVIKRIVDKMEAHAEGGSAYRGKCYICQSLCLEDAQTVAAMVEERFLNCGGTQKYSPSAAIPNRAR